MNIVSIIPARMGSSRFPGKPLAKICGIPMIGHCYFRSRMCKDLIGTYVATCDQEIVDYIEGIGGKAIMTSDTHERASDRTAEALAKIEQDIGVQMDIVVMVQGDEPMLTPEMISSALKPFSPDDNQVEVVNLMAEIETVKEFDDPNEVKVVVDTNNDAIYFSREPIPSRKKGSERVRMLKQVCIIPFTRKALLEFNSMEQTELEEIESVDMLRLLENGRKVRMVEAGTPTFSVDTKEDLERVEKLMKNDLLLDQY